MFKRIIVPLDGSAFAEAALAPARELARIFGSHIVLVRTVPPSGLPRAVAHARDESAFERLDEADAYLHGMVEQLQREGLDAGLVLYIAEPGTAIARAAEIDRADLIAMTAHPRWRADYLDNTSTTLQVLAHTRVPILAWRRGPGTEGFTRHAGLAERVALASMDAPILVPLDGSHFAEAALPVAEELARRFGSYLVLVRAYESSGKPAVAPAEKRTDERATLSAEAEATAYLERIREDVKGRGLGASAIVHRGSPAGVIDTVWREQNASLIVMASHGNAGVGKSFLGSTAARTVEDLGAPILIVQPDTEMGAEPASREQTVITGTDPTTRV